MSRRHKLAGNLLIIVVTLPQMNKEKKAWGLSILAAMLCPCCALPALLTLLGTTGAVAQFEFLHTLKPVFMLVAFGSLIYLWRSYFVHQKKHAEGEACCSTEKPSPYHNKYFLLGLTVFICSVTLIPLFI